MWLENVSDSPPSSSWGLVARVESPPASRSCSSCSLEPLLTSIQYKTGAIFKGYVANKPRSGKGSFRWTSGLTYNGEFKENKREGYGTLAWPDGSNYEGYFHNDVREGNGKHKWGESGELYEGKYYNDKRHGEGVYRWPSGASFTGIFKEDLKDGRGVYISPHGEKYEGNYQRDMREGEGVLSYPGGHQDVGFWKGTRLIRLKFAITEISINPAPYHQRPNNGRLMTPDVHSRGKCGPKGYLEVASQEFIQEAAAGNLSKVKSILEGGAIHVDVVDKKGHSALFASAMNGYPDIVNYLLDNSADVNQVDDNGISILNACHHVLYSSHPKIKTLLDKLQEIFRQTIPQQSSSSLSSGIGDTETIFTSELSSLTHVVEYPTKAQGYGLESDYSTADAASKLVRAKSVNHLGNSNLLSQGGHLYRVKSFPLLKGHGDKKVRFGRIPEEKDNSSSSGITGISSNEFKEAYASTSSSKTTDLASIKSKEIYIACGLLGKKFEDIDRSFPPFDDNDNSDNLVLTEGRKEEVGECSNECQEAGHDQDTPNGTEGLKERHLHVQSQERESDVSFTASADGDIMGVSTVNSGDASTDQPAVSEEGRACSSLSKGSARSAQELSRDKDKVTSLPNVAMGGFSPSRDLPGSITRPSTNPSRPGSIKTTSPLRHFKKHLSRFSPEMQGSSVFSSTHYGPIVSAAQSTTLSYVDSYQNVTDSSSTPSAPVWEDSEHRTSMDVGELGGLIGLLLSRGADPNFSTIPLQPMFYAVLVGEVEITKKLLDSGARADDCLPDELGGYTLLHVALGSIGPYSPHIVQLLLQFGADPNSGKRKSALGGSAKEEDDEDDEDDDDDVEEEAERKEGSTSFGRSRKEAIIIAGENEGGSKVSPLHMLCGVQLAAKSVADKKQLHEILPVLINMLVKHGADVNCVANGYSPLALAIVKGNDSAVETLLENGADPNLPLGRNLGSAICALTTHEAHRCRTGLPTSSCLILLQKLMLSGADIFSKVKLPKGGMVGTAVDFAHIAFKRDRRLSSLKFDSLTKSERTRYRSSKRLTTCLRNMYRCTALLKFASETNMFSYLQSKIQASLDSSTRANARFMRFYSVPEDKTNLSLENVSKDRHTMSAGIDPLQKTKEEVAWLPEITLTVSVNSLTKFSFHQRNSEVSESEGKSATPPVKTTKGLLPRMIRYKEILDKARRILSLYGMVAGGGRQRGCSFSSFCYECGRSSGMYLSECPGCRVVNYCSRTCKTENWARGHKEECSRRYTSFKAAPANRAKAGGTQGRTDRKVKMQSTDKTKMRVQSTAAKSGKGQKVRPSTTGTYK